MMDAYIIGSCLFACWALLMILSGEREQRLQQLDREQTPAPAAEPEPPTFG